MITLNGQNGITLNTVQNKPLAQNPVQAPAKIDTPKVPQKNDSFEKQTNKHSKLKKGAIIGGGAVVVLASVLGITRHINTAKIKKLIPIKLNELDEIGNEIIANLKQKANEIRGSFEDITNINTAEKKVAALAEELESIIQKDNNSQALGTFELKAMRAFKDYNENGKRTEKITDLIEEMTQLFKNQETNSEKYSEKFFALNSDNFIINQPTKLFEKYHDELNAHMKAYYETCSAITRKLTDDTIAHITPQNEISDKYVKLINIAHSTKG